MVSPNFNIQIASIVVEPHLVKDPECSVNEIFLEENERWNNFLLIAHNLLYVERLGKQRTNERNAQNFRYFCKGSKLHGNYSWPNYVCLLTENTLQPKTSYILRQLIDPAFTDRSSYAANHHKTRFATVCQDSVFICPCMQCQCLWYSGWPSNYGQREIYFFWCLCLQLLMLKIQTTTSTPLWWDNMSLKPVMWLC